MVAARTGLSQADAQQRIDSVVNQLNDAQQKLRQIAETAKKQAGRVSMATALAMLVGAFIASAPRLQPMLLRPCCYRSLGYVSKKDQAFNLTLRPWGSLTANDT